MRNLAHAAFGMTDPAPKIRIDKWLWHARFFKSRRLAAAAVEAGIRIDGTRITRSSRTVEPGNTLTFAQGRRIRVIKIVAIGTRRGPAPEAQGLYEDLTPPEEPQAKEERVGARPTKKARRQILKSTRPPLE